ncbi:ABC transporter permease [Nocardiopsis changdeensis]|uniref:ABC transporter permease n=1 Tax=Nocardiopsis changdeensis TaxID=2831969 RepID=UPI003F45B1D9
MGRVVLVARLAWAGIRRHRAQAVILVLAMTVATAAAATGLSLRGETESLYMQTREATAGPDVVVLAAETDLAPAPDLSPLAREPEVVAHNGPFPVVYATLTARGYDSRVVVHGADETPGEVGRPLLTSGDWVSPGGVVLERGFATALGAGVGDRVTIADRSYPVVGIAVTAATGVYPWAAQVGPGGGPTDYSGLAWLTGTDARELAARDLPVATALHLRLRDPDLAEEFIEAHASPVPGVAYRSWRSLAEQDAVLLRNVRPILTVGGWLLGFLAVTGVAVLAAGRIVEQTRRAGVLKAVGATPGLVAAVLFTEFLALALLANALGLVIARLALPAVAAPTASRIGEAAGPGFTAVAVTVVLSVAVAALATVRPALRTLRASTAAVLADTARRPQDRSRLTALSALLPAPLMLGLRITARRPGRAVLQACSTATTVIALTASLTLSVQTVRSYGVYGSSDLANLRDVHDHRLLTVVTVLLVVLAVVNTVASTWTTALEARVSMAVARALGATPGQITAGLAVAQLLPGLPGAALGLFIGDGVLSLFAARNAVEAPTPWLFGAALATLAATVALTALPARLAARRPVARVLSGETA